jgi:hypothetical protein
LKLLTINELITKRYKLIEELDSVYKSDPSTTYEEYKKAQDALKNIEDMTFTDKEIDKFLPRDLKREPK